MIDSSGLVDLTTYNKVLAERQRLSVALKKLQEASAGGILHHFERSSDSNLNYSFDRVHSIKAKVQRFTS
jgi:hypothetical protein